MKRLLSPATNLPGWMTLGFTLYAVIQAIANARAHHTAIGPAVIVAALAAGLAAYTRTQVTPVADPRDGNGQPLVHGPVKPTMRQVAQMAEALGATVMWPGTTVPVQADFSGSPRMDYRSGTTTGPASPQPEPAPPPAP